MTNEEIMQMLLEEEPETTGPQADPAWDGAPLKKLIAAQMIHDNPNMNEAERLQLQAWAETD